MAKIGIEKIRVYPTAFQLNLEALAIARNYDVNYMQKELKVNQRGVNPTWEDPVTMAVNAAKPMLTADDIASIGLLIVATETSLDQEKALSSWVFYFLGLQSTCRHFEIKIACYSGTTAIKMAMSWLNSGMAKPGQKALVITTDESLNSMHEPWEFILGAGAVAMLISHQPDFLEIEFEKFGVHSHEVTDVIRPLPWLEGGNSELSLYSYMEALAGAYEDYEENVGEIDFLKYFDYNIYHLPFSGISFRAHKQLMRMNTNATNQQIMENYNTRVLPSIYYSSQIGATYGGSVYLAILGLVASVDDVKPENRIGIFSYGSGSCAEYYSAIIGEKAKEIVIQSNLDEILLNRVPLAVEQYEYLETERTIRRQVADYDPDFTFGDSVYDKAYKGKNLLVFKGSKGYYRTYEFS